MFWSEPKNSYFHVPKLQWSSSISADYFSFIIRGKAFQFTVLMQELWSSGLFRDLAADIEDLVMGHNQIMIEVCSTSPWTDHTVKLVSWFLHLHYLGGEKLFARGSHYKVVVLPVLLQSSCSKSSAGTRLQVCDCAIRPRETIRTGIIEPDARTLKLPLLVWSDFFSFFFCQALSKGASFRCALAPAIQEREFRTS